MSAHSVSVRLEPNDMAEFSRVIEGDSEVRIYAVSNSTSDKIAAPVFARG